MRSAEKICGRTLEDAPAVHWKPLTASSRGGNSNRCESLVTSLQIQPTMKPKLLNSIFQSLFQPLSRWKRIHLTKDPDRVKGLRVKSEILADGLEVPGQRPSFIGPLENKFPGDISHDAGNPSAFDELVQKGGIVVRMVDIVRFVHERKSRIQRFQSKRESIANDAREAAIANSFSETEPMEENADGWFKVSPYGVFRGKTPGRPQHFHEDAAKRMVSEFNSLRGKLGRMFRGVPIYIGHPDVDPTIWTDDRRLGKATDLQARPDGLWAFGEWNSLGRENQTEAFWVYPSPRWDAPPGQPRFEPDRLISIGLTNTPRIETSEPLANSQLDTNTDTTTLMDPKLIREKLGLAPETTDEEVFAKIDSLTQAATDAESLATEAENAKAATAAETKAKDEMACSLQAAESNVIAFREAADNALLDLAERDGKITKADRAAWQAKLAGDKRDEAANSLHALKPKLNTQPLANGQSREDREKTDSLRESVANAVAKLQQDGGISYHEAWAQVKKRPEFQPYFNRES